uniref:Uncharacterized protein n=1 Tax=Escherichia coli TaxID=562 RepID=A0A8F1IET3_ECOLX|nr:hypothetical protein IHCLGBEB_00008 [Escherichia coli]
MSRVSTGPGRFSSRAASNNQYSAAVATVGGSGSLPVILRPDEVSEVKSRRSQRARLYGILILRHVFLWPVRMISTAPALADSQR